MTCFKKYMIKLIAEGYYTLRHTFSKRKENIAELLKRLLIEGKSVNTIYHTFAKNGGGLRNKKCI